MENQPSGLGWLPDGSLLVVSMKDQRLLRVASDGAVSTHADLSDVCGGHLNDLVVDASGRAFVGDFGFDLMGGGAPSSASVKRVDPDGSVTVVASDLRFPNGSVITPDGGTLIVGETWGNRFSAFDIAADGSLTNRRVWGAFGPEPVGNSVEELMGQVVVAPDGCTPRRRGAHLGGRRVRLTGAAGRAGRRDRRRDRRAGRDGRLRLRPGWGRRPRPAACAARRTSTSTRGRRCARRCWCRRAVAVPHAGLP